MKTDSNQQWCPIVALRTVLGLLFMILMAASTSCSTASHTNVKPEGITVPLIIDGNRPYIELAFRRGDGSARKARFLVDTGGGAFLLTEPLARDLGVQWDRINREGDQQYGHAVNPPAAFVGPMQLALDPQRVMVVLGVDKILPQAPGGPREGVFPGHLLAQHDVVFDYPQGTFTLAAPGALKPKGILIPMPVAPESGFPRTEVKIDGRKYGFLLDTGASFTIVSEVLTKEWHKSHPEWRHYSGAYGEAATLGAQTLETMFIPEARWAGFEVRDIGVTSQAKGTFEEWMSSMMTAPIVGSLAGNVLTHYRLHLDYLHQTLYVSRAP
jgi:predicted aspartyl protease